MSTANRQVLITGGAGWLGRGLLHALTQGLPEVEELREPDPNLAVRALILPDQDAAELQAISDRIEVVKGDVRNPEDCARFCTEAGDAVILHTAGVIHPRRVREFYEVNVEGTKNILEASTRAGIRRAVVVSSNSPCGTNPHPDHLFDEESPYRPYMHYGLSKMQMEQAVQERQSQGGLETVIIRAPWFYGLYQPPRQTLFFHMVRDGKAPIVGDGNNLRSMAYIDNLSQGILRAAQVPQASGQTYWIADERPYSMNEIIDTIERLLETEFGQTCAHKRMRLPGLASKTAWLIDRTLQGLGFYHQKIHVLSEMNKTIACSIARAREELGYQPTVALEEGMRRSLAWVQKHEQL